MYPGDEIVSAPLSTNAYNDSKILPKYVKGAQQLITVPRSTSTTEDNNNSQLNNATGAIGQHVGLQAQDLLMLRGGQLDHRYNNNHHHSVERAIETKSPSSPHCPSAYSSSPLSQARKYHPAHHVASNRNNEHFYSISSPQNIAHRNQRQGRPPLPPSISSSNSSAPANGRVGAVQYVQPYIERQVMSTVNNGGGVNNIVGRNAAVSHTRRSVSTSSQRFNLPEFSKVFGNAATGGSATTTAAEINNRKRSLSNSFLTRRSSSSETLQTTQPIMLQRTALGQRITPSQFAAYSSGDRNSSYPGSIGSSSSGASSVTGRIPPPRKSGHQRLSSKATLNKSPKYTCKFEGCTKWMRRGGFCFSHGGGRKCSVPSCSKSAQSDGKCFLHAGKLARCRIKGCYRVVWQPKLHTGMCKTCCREQKV